VLLIVGLFVMFYIPGTPHLLLSNPQPTSGRSAVRHVFNRKTLDFENEFQQHRQNLAELLKE